MPWPHESWAKLAEWQRETRLTLWRSHAVKISKAESDRESEKKKTWEGNKRKEEGREDQLPGRKRKDTESLRMMPRGSDRGGRQGLRSSCGPPAHILLHWKD